MRRMLANGGGYSLASGKFIALLNYDPALKATVKSIYSNSVSRCWEVGIGFTLLGFLIVMVAEKTPLRTELETEFGLDQGENRPLEEGTQTRSPGDGGQGVLTESMQESVPQDVN
ncbi:hypothetical protein DL764_000008 [Monosporascus ibericus]|uniref:Uncharacterized protein n=1 Tax=Monosporascus ibericus TaxID=155417 RepID=A0A4Q4TVB2_9PEZI|nr:hypothetical protein DL764_000008 [Monosporascus ibericus]